MANTEIAKRFDRLPSLREDTPPTKQRRGLFVIPVPYLFAIMTTFGLIMGWQAYQILKDYHKPHNYFTFEAANQLIDCYVWSFIALAIWQYLRFFSLQGPKWKRNLGIHVLIAMANAPMATMLYIGGVLMSGLVGLAKQDMSLDARMKLNLRAEFIPNVIEYFTILAILASAEYYRHYRKSQEENFHLQHALMESKLQALRAQLNPHFLFNAMNSVSCLLHRDAGAADRMLSRIANLLRLTLARDDSREVGLLEELELAEEYMEIQKIRFGSRLNLDIDVADETLGARVPNMLLQPLVENACVHGVARTRGDCRIEIKARVEGPDLAISIYNDGPPVRPDWKSNSGIGLRNTIERLDLLYGDRASLDLSNFRDGVRLQVRLPLQVDVSTEDAYDRLPVRIPAQPAVM
jgi:two-component system, LytTR family, sensor kinase